MKQINDTDLLNYAVEKFHCVPLVGVTDMNGILTDSCTLKELIEELPDKVSQTVPCVITRVVAINSHGEVTESRFLDKRCCACNKRIPVADYAYCGHCGTKFSGKIIQFVDKNMNTLIETGDGRLTQQTVSGR